MVCFWVALGVVSRWVVFCLMFRWFGGMVLCAWVGSSLVVGLPYTFGVLGCFSCLCVAMGLGVGVVSCVSMGWI